MERTISKLATYEYDTLLPGQPTATTSWVDGKPWRQETTSYDVGYRSTGTKLTVPAGEGALTGTYASETTYDPITGLERRTTLPAMGGLPQERLYTGRNANGLPTSYGSDNVDYVNFTDYDEFGLVKRTTFGDDPRQVSFTQTRDPATGRLLNTQLKKQDSSTPVDITDYTYNPVGDVTSVTSTQGAVRETQCFTHDYLRRLSQAWTDTGTTTTQPGPSVPGIGGCTNAAPQPGKIGGFAPYHQSFTYDVTGNRTSSTDHDPAGDTAKTVTTTHTYPAPGSPRPHAPTSTTRTTGAGPSVTKPTTYDAAGNTLTRPDATDTGQTLTWTPEGKLASATTAAGTSSYLYDANGNRLLRKDPGKTTLYLGSNELTLNTAADTVSGTRYYSTPGGSTIVRTSDGKIAYIAADHHNTGTTTVDAATLQVQRRATKPFGEDRGAAPAAWPGERGFVGGTQDKSTGLTHLGAREYDPLIGRFISVDPLMVVDDPRQHNGYQYGNNSPLTESDPTGEALPECQSGMYKCTNGSNPYDYGYSYEKEVAAAGGTLDRAYVERKSSNQRACRHDPDCKSSKSYWSSTSKKTEKKPEKRTLWDSFKSGASKVWRVSGTFVEDHWRGLAQAAIIVVGTIAAGVCVAATAGLCAGAGGIIIAGVIGATQGVATYGVGGGEHTMSGYATAAAVGAGSVGAAGAVGKAGMLMGGASATAPYQTVSTMASSAIHHGGRFWKGGEFGRKVVNHMGFGTRWAE
ncbi:RHS repeat-associated core domain-containing protein [Streptomyces sp. NPDC059752]|uniref:RHS repeat-associated core domain-containing protein n=1 Tax=unclassified Streptomyces TaxID=2593676 RepID=UPI00364F190D